MNIVFHKRFVKQYKKLPAKIQEQFNKRLALFLEDSNHPILNIHPLRGEDAPLVSMNITGDYRALYTAQDEVITFHYIGTHSQLYD